MVASAGCALAPSLGVLGFVAAAIPPIVHSEILPFGLPLHGVLPLEWSILAS